MQPDRSADDHTPTSVVVACVLYENTLADVWRCLRAVNRSAELALSSSRFPLNVVRIALGDCSARPIVAEGDLNQLRQNLPDRMQVDYLWFGRNLGHSAGINALVADAPEDAALLLNPDTYVAPGLLSAMLDALKDPTVVATDARQIPCEHPKWYDPGVGDQSWASGACLLVRTPQFTEVSGFDAETFPSYANDVDLSWRLRLRGGRVVHEPRAVVFHDKRLTPSAEVRPTATEVYQGTLARLLLATKYNRSDVIEELTDLIEQHGGPEHARAMTEYRRRQAARRLPSGVTDAAGVADFGEHEYGPRRF